MPSFTVLHISDIHIDSKSKGKIIDLYQKLCEDINKLINENELNIDLICFSGDLINKGSEALKGEKQIDLAEEIFVLPLLKQLNLPKTNFIYAPGNHEVDCEKIVAATEKGLASVNNLDEIDELLENMEDEYIKRIKYFYDEILMEFIPDAKKGKLGYSVKRNINGIEIGIACVDSCWRSSGKGSIERGKLLVGREQIASLYRDIKESEFKICIMHHPIDWLDELEMEIIESELCRFDLVLQGHVHDLNDKQILKQNTNTIFNISGKLYPLNNYYTGYSIINIDLDLKKCSIYSREYYGSPRNSFDKALRINQNGLTTYELRDYCEEIQLIHNLKLNLKSYFHKTIGKYSILQKIDAYSPQKISDFFVEPVITYNSKMKYQEGDKKPDTICINEIIDNDNNIVLVGEKEGGKTTLLQQIGLSLLETNNEIIPVYIDMLHLQSGTTYKVLVEETQHFILNSISENELVNKKTITKMIESGNIVYLLDNYSLENKIHQKILRQFNSNYGNNRFILTLSEKLYQSLSFVEFPDLGMEYKKYYINSFGIKQIREMVNKWSKDNDDLDSNYMTKRIYSYCNRMNFSKTPFNIAIFMVIWDIDKSFEPINEGKAMERYLNILLDKFSIESLQRSQYSFDIKQDFLANLAYHMYKQKTRVISKDEFYLFSKNYHERKGFAKSDTLFDVIFFDKNILCLDNDRVFFYHTSIMEYCLGYYAAIDEELLKEMMKKGRRGKFIRELSFYSGIVKDCRSILDELYIEISDTIIINIDVLKELENIHITNEFVINTNEMKENLEKNKLSINETDEIEDIRRLRSEPMVVEDDYDKIDNIDDSESFLDLLVIYGNTIKNAETADKCIKKFHLETYMVGMNFVYGLMLKQLSNFLESQEIEDLPNQVLNSIENIENKDGVTIKNLILDFIKLTIPIALQNYICENIGTPKLKIATKELIHERKYDQFLKFMLTFLVNDVDKNIDYHFLKKYIDEIDSKDIMKLIYMKLLYYYMTRYFGDNLLTDNNLISLITDLSLKLNGNSNKRIDTKSLERKLHTKLNGDRLTYNK